MNLAIAPHMMLYVTLAPLLARNGCLGGRGGDVAVTFDHKT